MTLGNLTHLSLTGVSYHGTLDALIDNIANSKLEFLIYTLEATPDENISLLLSKLSNLVTLKTLILIPNNYRKSLNFYDNYEILDSSSITSLNTPLLCKWAPGAFKNLVELINTCQCMNSRKLPRNARRVANGPNDTKYADSFTDWLIDSKLKKLHLLNLNTIAINYILDIIVDHDTIQEFSAIDVR